MLPVVAIGATVAAVLLSRQRVRRHFEEEVARRLPIGEDGVVVGAQSIILEGSRSHAVLIFHGFNDTPQSVAPLARALHARGFTVRAPLLPGHGRSLREAAEGRAEDWLAFARQQYETLAGEYERVMVCGQSMGGALAVLVAAKHTDVRAMALLAPYLGMPRGLQFKLLGAWVAQAVLPYRPSVGGERSIHDPEARKLLIGSGVVTAGMLTQLRRIAAKAAQVLPRVQIPTLYLQSCEDNRISAEDAERHFAALGAQEKVQRWLTGCGHIIAADFCREEVAQQVHDWFVTQAGEPVG